MRLTAAIATLLAISACAPSADQLDDTESIASDAAIEAIDDSTRLRDMQDEIDTLKSDLNYAKSDVDQLKGEVSRLRSEIDMLNSRVGY